MSVIKIFENTDQSSLSQEDDASKDDQQDKTSEFSIEVDVEGLKEILDKAPHTIRKINRLD